MVTVKNLTNSPYDLVGVDGAVRLPAFGEVTGEFEQGYVDLLEASMAVSVSKDADPLDHDGNGKKGGSVAVEDSDELSKLRADYAEVFGKRAYHGWTADELQEKIDAKLAS